MQREEGVCCVPTNQEQPLCCFLFANLIYLFIYLFIHLGRHIGWRGAFWSHVLLQLLATAVAIPLTLSLFTLLVWNFNLLSQNKTTIEHHEGVAAKLNAAAAVVDGGGGGGNSGGAKVGLGVRGSLHHPWDLGDWHSNVAVTFGEEVTDWVVPWRGAAAEGDGVGYKTKWDD